MHRKQFNQSLKQPDDVSFLHGEKVRGVCSHSAELWLGLFVNKGVGSAVCVRNISLSV